jgi:hypothetical protein
MPVDYQCTQTASQAVRGTGSSAEQVETTSAWSGGAGASENQDQGDTVVDANVRSFRSEEIQVKHYLVITWRYICFCSRPIRNPTTGGGHCFDDWAFAVVSRTSFLHHDYETVPSWCLLSVLPALIPVVCPSPSAICPFTSTNRIPRLGSFGSSKVAMSWTVFASNKTRSAAEPSLMLPR